MAISISGAVGRKGDNREADVRAIQTLLNKVPDHLGGPNPNLSVSGQANGETLNAISHFQSFHSLGTDGTVDPGGTLLKWLNSFGDETLFQGQKIPNKSETDASGAFSAKIVRGTPEFRSLVSNNNSDIIFKNEEGTGADRIMTPKLRDKLDALATKVKSTIPDHFLRVTEAWDENNEHASRSLHYEARAADITVSKRDSVSVTSKLGKLAWLAAETGFDWVWYEDGTHVHVSVKK